MAVVRCLKGIHFFDDEKFNTCPHCQAMEAGEGFSEGSDINSQITLAMRDAGSNVSDLVGVIAQNPPRERYHVDEVDNDVTVAFHAGEKGNDYITGWLVCISGPEKGRDYRIYHGINKLGRGNDMDIVIREDTRISREKVCDIIYDMKSNKFYIRPSTNGMIYIDNNMISEPRELVTGDTFTIGESTFEFIAFCRGDKKWE